VLTWALLLASVSGVYQIEPSHWRVFHFNVDKPGTLLTGSFEAGAHSAQVQILVLRRQQLARFEDGRSVRPVFVSGFEDSARFRTRIDEPGQYALILDNRIGGRQPSKVALSFNTAEPQPQTVRTLPPARRRVIVAFSLAFFGAVVVLSATLFLRAANRGG
jgi:hypothetical protein